MCPKTAAGGILLQTPTLPRQNREFMHQGGPRLCLLAVAVVDPRRTERIDPEIAVEDSDEKGALTREDVRRHIEYTLNSERLFAALQRALWSHPMNTNHVP